MKLEYTIVIPSYKREKIIQEKTLQTLQNYSIPPSQIHIFVANKEEYKKYKEQLNKDFYGKLIIGVPEIAKQRNFIRNYYPEGEKLLMMDDDIEDIEIKKGSKLVKIKNLNQLINRGFQLLKKEHCKMLGVYPVHNAYFMKNEIVKGLYFIVGCMYWCINSHDPRLYVKLPTKDDYELSLKEYLTNGSVLRLNNITIKTKYYSNEGGVTDFRTNQMIKKCSDYLINKYPQYVALKTIRDGKHEIKFLKQKNNIKIICRGG